jgi:hypothetical protein
MQHDFILLDRSGSMANQWSQALASVNNYVNSVAAEKVDTGVTLAVFDYNAGAFNFDIIRSRIIPRTWKHVSGLEVQPRGGTPLNEATHRIVALANGGFNGVEYERVAIIIMTDGYENQSAMEYTLASTRRLLDDCRAKNWQVIFLGASFDNQRQAESYGTQPTQFSAVAPQNLMAASADMGQMRSKYGLTGQAMNFTNTQKRSHIAGSGLPFVPVPEEQKEQEQKKDDKP